MNELEDPIWRYAVNQADSEGVRWGQLPVKAQETRLAEAKAAMEMLRYRGGSGIAEWLLGDRDVLAERVWREVKTNGFDARTRARNAVDAMLDNNGEGAK